jgi:Calcium/calmodulin dependent protein kinase II association domain
MSTETEALDFLHKHLQAVFENDLETYHATTHADLTLYEWWITPNRIDGIPFHDFMMSGNKDKGTVFGAEVEGASSSKPAQTRYDLANLKVQTFNEDDAFACAVISYTLLISANAGSGVSVSAHNESRVLVKQSGQWQVVHCHKSPAYAAPHTQT